MLEDYWWAIFLALALFAVLVVWLVLGRRRGVGSEAAENLRDLDGSRAARPTFARSDTLSTPPPLATGASVGAAEPLLTDPADPTDSRANPPLATTVSSVVEPDARAGDGASGEDLTRMKGLGPKLRDRLAELGVTRFDQIAAWSEEDVERVDAQLGRFAGRIRRDEWIDQARFLAADDRQGYEGRFGAL